jgi:IclR family transcriptional regulator, KDG regulon repressor
MSKAEGLKMVEIAMDLLYHLTNNSNGIGPREISRTFDISTTAAQRLVTSLEKKNCLIFDPVSQKYKLGYGLIRLVQGSIVKFDLVKFAQPFMEKLRDSTGETICLNTMADQKRVTISQEVSRQELRWIAQIGHVYPLFVGASGKVILANLPDEDVQQILDSQLTEEDAALKSKLLSELPQVKENGYCVTYGERIPGGVGIAVPLSIDDHHASLSVYAPSHRVNQENIDDYIKQLKDAANEIAKRFENRVFI